MAANDFYGLLELTPEATDKDITRAYRKKALKYHPDKNKSKEAVKIFHDLSKAYEVLLDPKARGTYDAVLKAKKVKEIRDQQLSAGRRKLKDELEAREQAAKRQKTERAGYREPAAEDFSIIELEKEIERLRKEGFQRVQAEQERLRAELDKEAGGGDQKRASAAPSPAPGDNGLARTLKIKWKKSDSDIYTQEAITTLLEKYGAIKHVIISAKKPGSGVVEFADVESARRAVAMETLLKLSWADPSASQSQPAPGAQQHASPAPVPSTTAVPVPAPADSSDFEAQVLANMRKTQEIRRQLAGGTSTLPDSLRDYESPVARELRLKEERQRVIAQMLAEDAD